LDSSQEYSNKSEDNGNIAINSEEEYEKFATQILNNDENEKSLQIATTIASTSQSVEAISTNEPITNNEDFPNDEDKENILPDDSTGNGNSSNNANSTKRQDSMHIFIKWISLIFTASS
jgi:hypothetical protein